MPAGYLKRISNMKFSPASRGRYLTIDVVPGWPLARTAYTPYYLHAGGSLSPLKPAKEPPATYLFDPRHPVPTLGGNISSQGNLMFQGAADQRGRLDFWLTHDTKPLCASQHLGVYQPPPLAGDTEVTGPLVVTLWASTSARDTDFTVKLVDVYPPHRRSAWRRVK